MLAELTLQNNLWSLQATENGAQVECILKIREFKAVVWSSDATRSHMLSFLFSFPHNPQFHLLYVALGDGA